MTRSLEGKVAIVTGAARGIGRSAALALAQRGADIALVDICSNEIALPLVDEITRLGRRVHFFQADVADMSAVETMVSHVDSTFGRLDILINNAACSVRQPFIKTSLEEARRTVQVTLWGTYLCCHFAAPRMVEHGRGGSIVMISSVHAERPYPNAVAYNMAKAGVNHLATSLARELSDHSIRVNTIEPGWIDTPGERAHNSETEISERGKTLPMRRLGEPEEIANAITFLCSDEASYITGATLRVDGGFALKF